MQVVIVHMSNSLTQQSRCLLTLNEIISGMGFDPQNY